MSPDIANTRTLLHESIPITGSIVSGTYGSPTKALGSETHIKTYGHGMFSSVFDYPFLSSSANHIFDVTTGYAATSPLSGASNTQNAKKINIYNQMAQYLVGYDETGSIKKFTMPTTSTLMKECYFVPFSRLLTKDEIKKGTFTLELGISGTVDFTHGTGSYMNDRMQITDFSGSDGYYVDSPAGEYGILYATQSSGGPDLLTAHERQAVGLVYYQAGVAVVSASVFNYSGILNVASYVQMPRITTVGDNTTAGFDLASTGSTIQQMSDGFRNRVYDISFNNTTELNSTIYFCRIGRSDYNYSSNTTYLTGSKIRVKTRAGDTPVSYFTTVGMYSADNELLAVAKLSEPLRKDPTNEVTLRVRLDY